MNETNLTDLTLYERLNKVQTELRAPKNKRNTFGNYSYRSAEDILESVKPLCAKWGLTLTISDDIREIGGRVYVAATARIKDALCGSESILVTGLAREAEAKKGMDDSQITGTASSYARKYALNGLFCIDDNQDADTVESLRSQALAQVVTAETREEFENLKRQYFNLIKSDAVTYRAFERMAQILPPSAPTSTAQPKSAEEVAKKAMNSKK